MLTGVGMLTAAAGAGARTRRWTLLATIAWFAFVTRFEPSVVRAGAMAVVVLSATFRGVTSDARHALAAAVLLLVLVDPMLASSVGILLSAGATVGVLVLAPTVRGRLPRWLPRGIADVLALTIGAELAVLPLLLMSFGEVPLAALPANLVAVPAAGIASAVAFVGSALALVHAPSGAVVLAAAGLPARVVLWAAATFADRGGAISWARPITVVGAVAAAIWLVASASHRVRHVAAAVVVVAVVVAGTPAVVGGRSVNGFVVTAIDVGQGDAFLVETPEARVLIDAGEDDTAARWLRANGRRRLDLLILTHPHLDHVGGAPEVLRRVDVEVIWFRPVPTRLPAATEVLDLAAERRIPVRAPVTGEIVEMGDLSIEVLHPPPGRPYRWSRSEPNDTSITVRLDRDGHRALFAGDIEGPAQRDLLEAGVDLDAELLAVPHHGSATTDPAFLHAVGPQVALISAGRDNRHGHPAPSTLAVLGELDARIYRTDEDGTIAIDVPAPTHAIRFGPFAATVSAHLVPPATAPHPARALPTARVLCIGAVRVPGTAIGSMDDLCAAAHWRRRPAAAAGTRASARAPP